MGTTPNLKLTTISETDNPLVKDFFQDLAGDVTTSNMQKIDAEVGKLRKAGHLVVTATKGEKFWSCDKNSNEIHASFSVDNKSVDLVYTDTDGAVRVFNYQGFVNGAALFYQTKASDKEFTGQSFMVDAVGNGLLTELPFKNSLLVVTMTDKVPDHNYKEIMDHIKSGGSAVLIVGYADNLELKTVYHLFEVFPGQIIFREMARVSSTAIQTQTYQVLDDGRWISDSYALRVWPSVMIANYNIGSNTLDKEYSEIKNAIITKHQTVLIKDNGGDVYELSSIGTYDPAGEVFSFSNFDYVYTEHNYPGLSKVTITIKADNIVTRTPRTYFVDEELSSNSINPIANATVFQALNKKISLPHDSSGDPFYGSAGQFAVSDGAGGITWVTIADGDTVKY